MALVEEMKERILMKKLQYTERSKRKKLHSKLKELQVNTKLSDLRKVQEKQSLPTFYTIFI